MSLNDKLLELDETIWNMVGAFTQYTQKELGWNKYDCAKLAISTGSVFGVGTGMGQVSLLVSSAGSIGVLCGISQALFSVFCYHVGTNYLRELKEKEEALLKKGMIYFPTFDPIRPLLEVGGIAEAGLGILGLFFPHFMYDDSITEKEALFVGLITVEQGLFFSSMVLGYYFSTQPPSPPTTKKSIWNYLSEKITTPFRTPQPVKVPTVNYQTIDDALV